MYNEVDIVCKILVSYWLKHMTLLGFHKEFSMAERYSIVYHVDAEWNFDCYALDTTGQHYT